MRISFAVTLSILAHLFTVDAVQLAEMPMEMSQTYSTIDADLMNTNPQASTGNYPVGASSESAAKGGVMNNNV